MFIVVVRGRQPKSRIRRWLGKKRFVLEQRQLKGASYCFIRTATEQIPWERILPLAGKNVQFLLEKGIEPPEGLPVFQGEKLTEKLLEQSFQQLLARQQPNRLSVVDYDGEQLQQMERYFKSAAQIRVITGRVEQYTGCSMELLQNMGASLLISRDIQSSVDSQMLYAPKGIRGSFAPSPEMIVVTMRTRGFQGGQLFYPRGFLCPAELEAAVPEGIAPVRFFSALYELSAFQNVGRMHLDIGA